MMIQFLIYWKHKLIYLKQIFMLVWHDRTLITICGFWIINNPNLPTNLTVINKFGYCN